MQDHQAARETLAGRWIPATFYALNVVVWLSIGVVAEAWDLLYLGVVTLPALVLYLWRTR